MLSRFISSGALASNSLKQFLALMAIHIGRAKDVRIMKLATDPGPNAVEVRVPLIAPRQPLA